MELRFSESDGRVVDLLRNISRELSSMIEPICSRVAALSKERTGLVKKSAGASQSQWSDDEHSLENLLDCYCRYERSASERLA